MELRNSIASRLLGKSQAIREIREKNTEDGAL